MMRRGLGSGLGTGYKNLAPRDPYIHSLSARGIKSYAPLLPRPNKKSIYHSGIFFNSGDEDKQLSTRKKKNLSIEAEKLKKELFHLLFKVKSIGGEKAKDKELLTIVLLRDKAHHLNFLQANTKWYAQGNWQDDIGEKYDQEKNFVFQTQFLDTKSERVGKRVIKKLERLNQIEIGEKLLYVDTRPIEESTLKLKEYR